MARQWGIITNYEGLQGGIVVTSLSFNESATIAEATDSQGRVSDLAAYSRRTTLNLSGVLDTEKGDLAVAGSKLTLGGKDYIIDSVSKEESATDFIRVSISAQTADAAVITPIED